MNHYMVCIDNNNHKLVSCDNFDVDYKLGRLRFFNILEDKVEENVAIFNFNNIKGFWREERFQ